MSNSLCLIAVLLLSSICSSNSFNFRPTHLAPRPVSNRLSLSMALVNEVVVVGVAGGVAESLFNELQSIASVKVSAVFDRQPSSSGSKRESSRVYYENDIESSLSTKDKIVILVAEKSAMDAYDNEGPIKSETVIEKVAKVMKEKGTPKSVIVATSAGSMSVGMKKGGFNLFSRGSIVEQAVTSLRAMDPPLPVSLIMYGDLMDQPEVPFQSALLIEPELHPSYYRQSVLFTSSFSNQYVQTEPCTQAALSETVTRLLGKQIDYLTTSGGSMMKFPNIESEVVVTSINGPQPNEKQWEGLFQRVLNIGVIGAELLKVDFKSVEKKQQLLAWITNTWFPQALIEADAATILSGARPVRAALVPGGQKVELVWEDLNMDTLRPSKVGALEITISDKANEAGLSVRRTMGKSTLPGEGLLMDKLLEGVNKAVFRKGFATPIE